MSPRARGQAIPVLNAFGLSDLLTDKLATHDHFEDLVPLTWSTETPDLVERLQAVRLHSDLSAEKLVLKPRFGERGRGIDFTQLHRLAESTALPHEDYILQAFLETCSGIPELDIEGRHDVRLILRDGEIALAFARLPASGSFISNCSQGGREIPLCVDDLQGRITDFAAVVDAQLSHFGSRLYSLDLGIGRSGKIWIYELNTMPGIVWDRRRSENMPLHREMHRTVADWLSTASSCGASVCSLPGEEAQSRDCGPATSPPLC